MEREVTVEVPSGAGAEVLEASFGFTNVGEADVTVTSVKASCGCTAARLEKTVYGPGESGAIEVAFTVGDRVGSQAKQVVVRTDDPGSPVTTLTLRAEVPRPVEVRPRLLRWSADEELRPKTVEVLFNGVRPAVLTGAEVDDAGLAWDVEELEPGRRYAVTVDPDDGVTSARSVVRLVAGLVEQEGAESGTAQLPGAALPGGEALRFLVRVDEREVAVADAGGRRGSE